MGYLIASATTQPADLTALGPERVRAIRRFNLPVQLALAAAFEVAAALRDPASAALLSLAPCRNGSPELLRWVERVAAGRDLREVRINPVHTLHAVDNLALSALAIELGNHAECAGFGGGAGQAWCALEAALQRVGDGDGEALLLAGEQEGLDVREGALGVAIALSATPPPEGPRLRVVAVERRPGAAAEPAPSAAAGLSALLRAIHRVEAGTTRWEVPPEHGDGLDAIAVVLERTG